MSGGKSGFGSLCSISSQSRLVSWIQISGEQFIGITNGCFVVYFYCPETRGKSLEEIDLIFLKSDTIINSAAAKTLRDKGKDTKSSEMEEGKFISKEAAVKIVDSETEISI